MQREVPWQEKTDTAPEVDEDRGEQTKAYDFLKTTRKIRGILEQLLLKLVYICDRESVSDEQIRTEYLGESSKNSPTPIYA